MALLLTLAAVEAAQSSVAQLPAARPIARAFPAKVAPTLDGNVVDDPAWQGVQPASGFWQIRPNEGAPASERTEVRLLYNRQSLFIGVICYDSDPSGIIVSDSRRDASLNDTDSFQIILDTFRDRQNGFVFGTNPAAIEYDGQVTREGAGTGGPGGAGGGPRQQGGSGGGFNLNWDASWTVRAQISEIGWSAEFAIPFRTLRYGAGQEQVWGVNFQRNIRRRNETSFWAPLTRQYNLYRLSQAGTLEDLHVPAQRNLKVTPYVLGQVRNRELPELAPPLSSQRNWTGEVGGEIKFNVAPSLTLDLTYNTDFAQVEVDEQQINLDRFNLFFPEKRPFFLENAGFFSVGDSGETELFFSRRIGISEDGVPIPIVAGARLSGKLGTSTNLGLLNMQTSSFAEEDTPANNFTVIRLNRELPNRSAFGGIFVNRQGTGSLAADSDYNRTFGVDGRWGIGELGEVSGFLAGTSTPGVEGDEYAFQIQSAYRSPSLRMTLGYTQISEDFNPEVGFLRREGVRSLSLGAFHTRRLPGSKTFLEVRPHLNYDAFWNFDGFQESGRAHIDNHLVWEAGHEFHTGVNLTKEGVTEAFTIYEDPRNPPTDSSPGREIQVLPGTYDNAELALVFISNRGAPLSGQVRFTAGGFFSGSHVVVIPSLRWRLGESFNTEFSLNRNDIKLDTGDFVTNLARARISYSFSPRMSLQSLVQYNDRSGSWSTNIRFTWLQAANTGLFIVYNDNRGISGAACVDGRVDFEECFPTDRSLIIKFSRLFDLLN